MKLDMSAMLLLAAMQVALAAAATPEENDVFATAPNVLLPSQLEKIDICVRFRSSFMAEEEEIRQRLKDRPNDVELKERAEYLELRRQRLEKSPIAIYLPKTDCRLDEPVYAFFVVKNMAAEPVGLDMRLDLQIGHRTTNSCSIDLKYARTTSAEPAPIIRQHVWECGGPPRITLPPQGFYCTRADLRKIGVKVPGTYRISWTYSGLVSPEVEFTVAAAKKGKSAKDPVSQVRIARIVPASRDEAVEQVRQVPDPPPPPVIRPARLFPQPPARFAAGLATGAGQRFYPDLLDLPSSDDSISASLQVEKPAAGKLPSVLMLTLTPRQPNKGLLLRQMENLVLIAASRGIETAVDTDYYREEQEQAKLAEQIGHSLADPEKPLQIRIELEDDWPRRLGLSGPVELQVLISSAPIELQGNWPELRSLTKTLNARDRKPWNGLLCTPAVEVELPPPRKGMKSFAQPGA